MKASNIPKSFPEEMPVKFPLRAGSGNVTVTMYRTTSHASEEYRLPYRDGGARKFHRFFDYTKARERANLLIKELAKGQIDAVTLTNRDREIYLRAVETLKPYGVDLDIAAHQLAEVYKIMATTGATPVEAARYYVRSHKNKVIPKAVGEAVDEFIAAKREVRRSERHLEDLTYRLGKFKTSFQCQLGGVTEMELRMFLDGLKLSPRSRNNFQGAITSLYNWAKKKKFVSADWSEFASIELVDEDGGEIEIFTPEEIGKLLTHAEDKLVPFLALGAFAGLRSSEICRLDWAQVGIEQGKYIDVRPDVARKTRQRRHVPISENLRMWLRDHQKKSGPVWALSDAYLYEALEKTSKAAGVKWKKNALRHSYISYRIAQIKNDSQVALEAGNSPKMVFQHYREVVSPEQSEAWFGIKPAAAENVVDVGFKK